MKSIKQQYIDLREGNMSQANFMRNLRMTLPQYITNVTSFDDSIKILKNKGILTEADVKVPSETLAKVKKAISDITANNDEYHRDGYTMGFFEGEGEEEEGKKIDSKINEGYDEEGEEHSIAVEKDLVDRYKKGEIDEQTLNKALDYVADHDYDLWGDNLGADYVLQQVTDEEDYNEEDKKEAERVNMMIDQGLEDRFSESLNEVKDEKTKWTNTSSKSMYDQFKEIDNLNAQEVITGLDWEMEKNPELTKAAAAKIVIKNLKKNPLYYTMSDLAGKEGAEAEYLGGKSANPEAHQMQYLDKNMGNVVDKKRKMQPVKGIEKPKKDADAKKETNKAEKGIKLMSLIAKTVRGLKKMDATGEKMKKIAMKENKVASTIFDKNANITKGIKAIAKGEEDKTKLVKDKLKELIRRELKEYEIGDESYNVSDKEAANEIAYRLIDNLEDNTYTKSQLEDMFMSVEDEVGQHFSDNVWDKAIDILQKKGYSMFFRETFDGRDNITDVAGHQD